MKYLTETVACPECLGDGTLTYVKPEPWVSRDTPPSMEEVTQECWACHGTGETEETEIDEIDF
jgi:DnaJ-class molecular chaperone